MDPEEDVQSSALKLRFKPVRLSEGRTQQLSEQGAGRVPVFHTVATAGVVAEALTVESAGAPPAGELKSCHSTAIAVALQNASSLTTVFPDIDSVKIIKEIWLKDNSDLQSPGIAEGTLRGIFIRSQTARKDTKLREGSEDPVVSKEQQDPIMPESTSVEMSVKDLEDKIYSLSSHLANFVNLFISKINAMAEVINGAFKLETIERFEMCDQGLVDAQDQLQDENRIIETLQIQNKNLAKKVDYLENQSRRNNVKIVGLPEGIEGPNPRNFFTEWIPRVLGQDKFPEGLILERAYRVLRRNSFSGQNPRSVLICCLNYCDRETILRTAIRNAQQNRSPLMVQNNPVFFYQDLSQEIMFQRREFNSVKERLWKKRHKGTFRYSAVLKIF
ncbi:uncharacterized protein [Narcine bancroftii]|uniref:uncharacterized protein n=1 Tax=Narcine bancroftii TaxID=1343680 RepID=UPI00383166C7